MTKHNLIKCFAGACLFAIAGCHRSTDLWALTDVNVALPEITGNERPVRRAGTPGEFLHIHQGGTQTVLIRCTKKDNPKKTDDQWSRAHVIVLEGPLALGTYDVNPINSRLIENSSWRPAREPYSGLEGEITIKSIKGNEIVADCSIRNVIKRTGDPVYALRGEYEFELAPAENIPLHECAIHMVQGAR